MVLGLTLLAAGWNLSLAAASPAQVSQPKYKWVLEKDVSIPMRDGAILKADVFRPDSQDKFPIIMDLTAYQKEALWVPPSDLEEKANQYMNWETGNPEWWCPRGYILVRVDSRGSGKSPGFAEPWLKQEALDFYDAIEWAGVQRWSNGNVGLLGISYMAMDQWWVAMLQPPHLKAMIPWEGAADMYRDAAYHGGIYNEFMSTWYLNLMFNHLHGPAQTYNPDALSLNWIWHIMRNRLDTGFYKGVQAEWDKIVVPLYSVGNWSMVGLHLRGNTEGFVRAASQNKKLRIHSGTHFHPFYSEEGRMDQIRFFDQWLKGIDTGIMNEPRVKACVRTEADSCEWRYNKEWPFDNTQWTKFYLSSPGAGKDAPGSLSKNAPTAESVSTYASQTAYQGGTLPNRVSFITEPMAEDTEVIGPVNLVMWVSSSKDDMNIFATVRNIDPNGKEVLYPAGSVGGDRIPVTKGWLKVSHRKLDPKLSTPYRPYHTHDEEQKLKPGEVVKVEVEIWPTGTAFKKGHRLRLDVQPTDGSGAGGFTHRVFVAGSLKQETNSIYAGGSRASYVVLPVIPATPGGSSPAVSSTP
ncbi:MAG: CocE/NonD family hydrolase [Dehalococcoidia bacterium]|nr:CocE/NonD family hydrolase [Dehalococcoidia bacterium]